MTFSGQCLDSRFTFVLYVHPDVVHMIDRYENVKIVEYAPEEDAYYSTYRFAKSLLFVYDDPEPLLEYDYIIKTDTDVLFTPKMNEFQFTQDKIYIGRAFYTAHESNTKQLKDVAYEFGYDDYEKISDMHSTIIGPTKDIIKSMELSEKLCKQMYYYLEEPGEWHGEKLWRGYYGNNSGICSMYATEIVLSSGEYKKKTEILDTIDGPSQSETPWDEYYHYHCYHHDYIYSKHQAKYGSYRNVGIQSGDSSAAFSMNLYVNRRDAGLAHPERFAKPEFTVFEIPYTWDRPEVKYYFNKEVD